MRVIGRTTAVGAAGLMVAGAVMAGGAPASAASYPPLPQLPLKVKPVNRTTYTGGWNTIVRLSRTSNQGVVKRSVIGRSLRPSAAGEVTLIRTRITRAGGVQVRVIGSGPVRVNVRMRAVPKKAFEGKVRPSNTFKRSWTLRNN